MRLCDVLSESSILVDLHGLDKWELIERLTDQFVESGQAPAGWREAILGSLKAREEQSSTGMQDGFAIPHCRMDDPIDSTLISLAVLAEGMDFEAIDGQPTNLVVCLVTPRKQNREHLRILAEIAQLFANPEFRAELLAAKDSEQALAIIRAGEEKMGV